MGADLPPRDHLPTTGPVDWVRQYYTPGIGFVLRRRLAWTAAALPAERLDRVLDIGYGSGIFQYELGTRARLRFGVDVHEHGALVRDRLRQSGIDSSFLRASGAALPFTDGSFDAVVIVSALEFVPDPAACLRECRRVLRRGGRLVCLVPRELRWADRIFRLLTGKDPEAEFMGGRARVRVAIATELGDAKHLTRPAGVPAALAPYEVLVVERNGRP